MNADNSCVRRLADDLAISCVAGSSVDGTWLNRLELYNPGGTPSEWIPVQLTDGPVVAPAVDGNVCRHALSQVSYQLIYGASGSILAASATVTLVEVEVDTAVNLYVQPEQVAKA